MKVWNKKVYVPVTVDVCSDGTVLPRMITWADGTRYLIDRVTDVRLAARMRSGGLGDRYTVHINGRKSYLYFERSLNLTDANLGRWFVVRR